MGEELVESVGARATAAPSDWHASMVNARAAWALFGGDLPGRGVLVGHPDTGYTRHPELGDEAAWEAALARGINLLEEGRPPLDPLDEGPLRFPGHGTATGSIIVSAERGEIDGIPAVVGLAPGARLLPIRVARTVVTLGWTSRLAKAIERVTAAGCHVISMSLGGLPSSRLARAVRQAHAEGVIVVAAAGNVVQLPVWPANYDEVVSCAACGPDRRGWAGTSKGPSVDITAPGHLVQVAGWDPASAACTRPSSGTSFATAILAGTAARPT